jgi:hypothetical protein
MPQHPTCQNGPTVKILIDRGNYAPSSDDNATAQTFDVRSDLLRLLIQTECFNWPSDSLDLYENNLVQKIVPADGRVSTSICLAAKFRCTFVFQLDVPRRPEKFPVRFLLILQVN